VPVTVPLERSESVRSVHTAQGGGLGKEDKEKDKEKEEEEREEKEGERERGNGKIESAETVCSYRRTCAHIECALI